jgi:hypothetical protein
MNFFLDKNRFKTIDALRLIYLASFVISFALTEAGRYIYRPYIYENGINDFGIADSMGNLGGIIVQIFFGMMILNPLYKKGVRLIFFFVFGYIVYEILQPYLPKGTFDWLDIYGTLLGGIFSFGVFWVLHHFYNKRKIKTKHQTLL